MTTWRRCQAGASLQRARTTRRRQRASCECCFALCVQINVRLRTQWIPGPENTLLDARSQQYRTASDWRIAAREMLMHQERVAPAAPPSPYLMYLGSLGDAGLFD
jgi:hypothetical protein